MAHSVTPGGDSALEQPNVDTTIEPHSGDTKLTIEPEIADTTMEPQSGDNTIDLPPKPLKSAPKSTVPKSIVPKPTVHILVVSDVVCPWCWVAKRSLENAMDTLQEKFNFDVHFSPFLLRPKTPKEGIPNVDFNNKDCPRNQHLSEICKGLDIDMTFSCPIVPCSIPALTFRQYVRESNYPNVVQSQAAEKLYEAYFTRGQELTKDDLLQIARELMLDMSEVEAYLDDPENEKGVIDQAESWRNQGVQAVPFFFMNGKAACSGAQETNDFVRTILKVAERFPVEMMGDGADA